MMLAFLMAHASQGGAGARAGPKLLSARFRSRPRR